MNIDNNTIYGEAGNVDYSRANNIISASDLKAKFSTAEGTEVNVNVGSLKYEEQAFFLQGLNGDLSFNLGSLSMTAGITDGSYDQSGFSVPSATGNISVKGKNIALSGTELKYSKDAGFDFKTLEGGVEGNVEVFSGFTLKEGKVSVSKGAGSGEAQGEQGEAGAGGTSPISVTLEAGVEAKKGKFSLTAKNTKFTVSDDGVNDAHIVNAILDIDNTIHGEVGNLDYSKENNVISATDLSVDFSTAKGTAVKVNVGRLKYEEKAFSLQGISGDLSINLGSTSMTAKITGGSYDQNGFSVQSAAGNISVLGKNINLSGTNLKYSKEAGFDFKTLGGAIEGNTEIFPGFTLLGGKVSAAKGEAGEGDEMVVQEYDIQVDREQMTKNLVNSQEVDNLVSTIVIDDPDTIVNFGNEAAQEISRCSDVVLNSMNMSQINDSGEMLTLLANIMGKFDVNELVDGKQGVLSKLFSNAKRQLEQILSKYHTMGEEVDKIYVKLKQYESEIKQSNKSLEEMFHKD